MATWTCRIVGVIFVAIGLVVIVRGGQVDPYHNLLHVATGVVALYVGFVRSVAGARAFCLGFGAFYLALGGLGLVLGDPTMDRLWNVGPLSLELADHLFHIVLGLIFLASALFSKSRMAGARVAAAS